MTLARSNPPNELDRAEAARLLREAQASALDDGEAIDWAYLALPGSPAARRLKIRMMLAQGDNQAAETLIAQGLLWRPTDAGLSLLRARALYTSGRIDEARDELKLVLAMRPEHSGALELAGRIALRRRDPLRAADFFRQADARKASDGLKAQRVIALLKAQRVEQARVVLRQMDAPGAILESRVLIAEGRRLEAAEMLTRARTEAVGNDYDAITCALIDILEETTDTQRLGEILAGLTTSRPASLARAGSAWLSLGSFTTAIRRMSALARDPAYRVRALVVLMVAAAMANRPTLAKRTLARLRRTSAPLDRAAIAATWCRGLMGRTLNEQHAARKAADDPHSGRLGQLLEAAGEVFGQALAADSESLSAAQRRELEHHLAVCRGRIGLPA